MERRREKEWQENLRNELEFEEREVQATERIKNEKKQKQLMREQLQTYMREDEVLK